MAKQNSKTNPLRDWHEILGHCNYFKDVLALEGVVDGMKVVDKREFDCDVCVMGKMTQFRNREPDRCASKILQLIHYDFAGPIQPAAKDGFRYAISFTDDFSGIIMIYFIRQKSDTVSATEKFLADSAPYGKVKCLRSNNGTEFTSESFQNLLLKHSIKHEKSASYSPHQNCTAERGWRSIFEMARCLLIHAALPKNLWSYAAMCAVYIRNRCYNDRLNDTLNRVREIIKDYPIARIMIPGAIQVILAQVLFLASMKMCKLQQVGIPVERGKSQRYLGHVDDNNVDEKDNISFTVHYCYCMSDVPETYQQAISSPDSCKWQSAMEEEMQALTEKTIHLSLPVPPCLKAEKQWGVDGFMLLNKAQMAKRNIKLVLWPKGTRRLRR